MYQRLLGFDKASDVMDDVCDVAHDMGDVEVMKDCQRQFGMEVCILRKLQPKEIFGESTYVYQRMREDRSHDYMENNVTCIQKLNS